MLLSSSSFIVHLFVGYCWAGLKCPGNNCIFQTTKDILSLHTLRKVGWWRCKAIKVRSVPLKSAKITKTNVLNVYIFLGGFTAKMSGVKWLTLKNTDMYKTCPSQCRGYNNRNIKLKVIRVLFVFKQLNLRQWENVHTSNAMGSL